MKKLKAQIKPVKLFGKVNISLSSANGRLQAKTVYPSEERQEVLPTDNHFALSAVYVEAAPLQSVTLNPSELMQNIAPESGFYGIDSVTVNPAPLQEKTVTPGDVAQEITADEGYYGMKKVVVEAVTGGGGGEVMLQDLTVTPTDEVQTFFPDEGFDGFSSVTVEAVESSGGSGDSGEGGSGSGGDSGGGYYPDIEDTDFGYTVEEKETPTGFVTYTKDNGVQYKFKEIPDTFQYAYLYYNSQGYTLYLAELPFRCWDDYPAWAVFDSACAYERYEYDTTNNEWALKQSGTSDRPFAWPSSYTFVWCNHDIVYRRSGSLYRAADVPLGVDVQISEVETPVEVEENYIVSGTAANSVVISAMKITGQTELMSFSEAALALEDYAASLE